MATRRSAAWVITIVVVLGFIVGALILTATDPVVQALFGSDLWSASTADGKNALTRMERAWAFFATAILIALLVQIWVDTRQST